MNCPECGKPIPEGQEKCPSCGNIPLNLSAEATAHINLLKKKIEKDPLQAQYHLDLGDLYYKYNVYREALNEYQKTVEITPSNCDAHVKSAHIYLRLKETDKAEQAFHAALRINPKSTEALIGLFRSYYLQNKTVEAIALGEKLIESKPDNVEFHLLLKHLYNQKGDKEKAFNELIKLESLVPDNEHVIREIALHYQNENNMEKLDEYYHKMLKMSIEDSKLGFFITKHYYKTREYDKAIDHLNDLLNKENIAPEMVEEIVAYLALSYFHKGDVAEARKFIDGMPLSPAKYSDNTLPSQLASMFYAVGQKSIQDNKVKDAITVFEKAVNYDTKNSEYRKTLGNIKNDLTVSNKKLLRKVLTIGISVIALFIVVVLAWILVRNRIIIHLTPSEGAVVFIDGEQMQPQPDKPETFVSSVLFMGGHSVVVEKPGYQTWQGTVNIGIGRPTKTEITLVAEYFTLVLSSVPENAAVTIDDVYVGTTPFMSRKIPACPHIIEVAHEGHATWSGALEANAGDSADLGVIVLKNLAGKWQGKIGEESYAYNPYFSMTIEQTGQTLSIKYSHQPRDDSRYSGTIKGTVNKNEFYAEGKVTHRYKKVFYWAQEKKNTTLKGRISDDWNRIEGQCSTENLPEQTWWATRR